MEPTCLDCKFFDTCFKSFGCKPSSTVCVFTPSQFDPDSYEDDDDDLDDDLDDDDDSDENDDEFGFNDLSNGIDADDLK